MQRHRQRIAAKFKALQSLFCKGKLMDTSPIPRLARWANWISPIVAGPSFCFSISIPLWIAAFLRGHGGDEGALFPIAVSLFLSVTFALPIGYIVALAFIFPVSAIMDQWCLTDIRRCCPGYAAVLGAGGGLAFGIFLWVVIRPGHNMRENILLGAMLLLGSAGAGAATMTLRHRLVFGKSGKSHT